MKKLFGCTAVFLLTACGGNAAQTEIDAPVDTAVADAAESAGFSQDVWLGDWRLRDEVTDKVVAQIEFRMNGERLSGQYTLTKDFCQTTLPGISSHCPFVGQGGSWWEIETNPNTLMASARDPFLSGEDFVLTLFTADGATIDMASILADGGRVSISGELQRAPG